MYNYTNYSDAELYIGDGEYWSPRNLRNLTNRTFAKDIKHSLKKDIFIDESNFQKIISTCRTLSELKNKIMKRTIIKNLSGMILNYCKVEKLPDDYVKVAQQDNILFDVIVSHFEKLGLTPNMFVLHNLVGELLSNTYERNIYNKVKSLQRYCHAIAVVNYGVNSEFKLNTELMRRLLSFTRLYLNILQIKSFDMNALRNEIYLNNLEMNDLESKIPDYVILGNKKKIKNWKMRHLRSLICYTEHDLCTFIMWLLKEYDDNDIEYNLDKISYNIKINSKFWGGDD